MTKLFSPLRISAAWHGRRIDIVLAQCYPDYSRSQLSHWLKEGLIRLNQKTCKPKDQVRLGDEITFLMDAIPSSQETLLEAENIPLCILYEDKQVLVINKPAGLVVHPGAGNRNHTLVNALVHHDAQLQALPRAGIVHRLDKDTTGLLLVAKTFPSYTYLVQQMQARKIERHYLALAQGSLMSSGKIQTFYGRHPKHRLKMAVLQTGREAITLYSVKKRFGDAYTLLDIQLLTGRTHQIRVHFAYTHHPLVGDNLYGYHFIENKTFSLRLKTALMTFHRQALHARTLRFSHPQTFEPIQVEAPIPDDFLDLLTALEEHFESDHP